MSPLSFIYCCHSYISVTFLLHSLFIYSCVEICSTWFTLGFLYMIQTVRQWGHVPSPDEHVLQKCPWWLDRQCTVWSGTAENNQRGGVHLFVQLCGCVCVQKTFKCGEGWDPVDQYWNNSYWTVLPGLCWSCKLEEEWREGTSWAPYIVLNPTLLNYSWTSGVDGGVSQPPPAVQFIADRLLEYFLYKICSMYSGIYKQLFKKGK